MMSLSSSGGKPIDVATTELPHYEPIADFEQYRALALASDAGGSNSEYIEFVNEPNGLISIELKNIGSIENR